MQQTQTYKCHMKEHVSFNHTTKSTTYNAIHKKYLVSESGNTTSNMI